MLYATCEKCGKAIRQPVNGEGVLVELEPPDIIIDEDTKEELGEEGGRVLEMRILDGDGEPLNEHLCLNCTIYTLAQANSKDKNSGDDGSDGDDDGEADPVAPVTSAEEE